MVKHLFVVLVLLSSFAFVHAEDKVNMQDMQVACAIVNGRLNNGPQCTKLQKKLVEDLCKKGDPNSCKALSVAKEGVDKSALEEKRAKKEQKPVTKKIPDKKEQKRGVNE